MSQPITPDANALIDAILQREGSVYTDRATDRGGPTKYGITQATLAKYRGHSVTAADVAALTESDARTIYLRAYVDDPEFDHIDDVHLRSLLVDSGVQHGPERAVRWVQRAAGVKVDGVLGPISLSAIDAENPLTLYMRVLARRVRFYGRLISADHTQAANAAGWANRVAAFIDDDTLWTQESRS